MMVVKQEKSKSHTTKRKGISRTKLWLFRAVIVIFSLLFMEFASYCALYWLHEGFRFRQLYENQKSLANTGLVEEQPAEVIHPYVGWVVNPEVRPNETVDGRTIPTNQFGWIDDNSTIPKRGDDRLVVAVTGGSVAWYMSILGEATFRKVLAGYPEFQNREIVIVRLAQSGHKQPQQLMSVNYFYALGAEFDVILNIDGFNEIALAVAENDQAGVFAAYPRGWHARLQNVVDSKNYMHSWELLEIRGTRQRLAADMTESPLRWSPTRNLVWLMRDRHLSNQLVELESTLRDKRRREGHGFHVDGPPPFYDNETEMYEHVVSIWSHCNVQLHRVCEANMAVYVGIVQPNQYHLGSKTLTDEERLNQINLDFPYDKAIERGYPFLIEAAAALREQGAPIHDLTMLFSDIKDSIYIDSCCHYNQRGNDLLAEQAALFIIEAWKQRSEQQRPPSL